MNFSNRSLVFQMSFHIYIRILLCILFTPKQLFVNGSFSDKSWKCEPVRVSFCQNIQYNSTIKMSPIRANPYTNKESQLDSVKELTDFNLLIKSGCSEHLRLFLCSVYLPFCSHKVTNPITACRGLCVEVRDKCSPKMIDYGYVWPPSLDCSKFPKYNDISAMCLDGGLAHHTTREPTATATKITKATGKGKITYSPTKRNTEVSLNKPRVTKITSVRTFCRLLYVRNNRNYFYVENIQACALGCMADGLFTYSEKQLAEKWLSVLSCICVVLCITALLVVIFNYHKTCYPERTIIFITICYLFYALAYLIRIVYSRENVTCRQENGRRYTIIDGSGNISCAATFLLSYCFSIAQNIWWVMLCVTWFLSAGMKWSSNAIKSRSTYFHFISWSVPCAILVVILVLRKIDVNELTGMCSIGNRYENLTAMRAFILGPLFTFLIMGIVFLVFGFIALLGIPKNEVTLDMTSQRKSKQPLNKVVTYAAIHTFLSTFILATYFYEYFNKIAWYENSTSAGPNSVLLLMRIITDFLIGICSSIWLLINHIPPLCKKFKRKMSKSDLLLSNVRDRSTLDPLRAGTNETSI